MKVLFKLCLPVMLLITVASCNSGENKQSGDGRESETAVSTPGSTAGFKLGVQLWTFRLFSFTEAVNKVDSAGIKNIEAFWGQKLGGDLPGEFGPAMSSETRTKVKELLRSKGISLVAFGVISPGNEKEWISAFELAKDFGLSYITTEPKKEHWDFIDSLAGAYNIKLAIHDHPFPSAYATPDSVLAAINGRKNIGACADIGHWARNGLNPVDCLKQLEGHIYGGHLKDIVEFDNPKSADTLVSKGVIDFPAVFTELKRQNFSGMLSIEHESNWENNLPDVIATKEYYNAEVEKLNQ
ncbi:MAG: sugar phosphate isomerase/epimerase [Chitinophagaceae bacterium]|nr:sugar phosphate isomerase/epimerase [Chitinophagaceae bacterium]MCW5928027.1 sugar phosphate isomerase/epimerase [Chitinophagaceae bacterium]